MDSITLLEDANPLDGSGAGLLSPYDRLGYTNIDFKPDPPYQKKKGGGGETQILRDLPFPFHLSAYLYSL